MMICRFYLTLFGGMLYHNCRSQSFHFSIFFLNGAPLKNLIGYDPWSNFVHVSSWGWKSTPRYRMIIGKDVGKGEWKLYKFHLISQFCFILWIPVCRTGLIESSRWTNSGGGGCHGEAKEDQKANCQAQYKASQEDCNRQNALSLRVLSCWLCGFSFLWIYLVSRVMLLKVV